jgi:hypothetical protein
MNVFDFVGQEELDDLPEDDHLAFATFVRHAQRRLSAATDNIDGSDSEGWRLIEEWRYDFINLVLAAAKKFGIEPFATMEVPTLGNFDDSTHRQFKADLDFYMTQLVIDNTLRDRRDSVLMSPTAKERIRNYLHELKQCIDKASLSEGRKAALLKKLADFEATLDGRRLSLLAVTRFTLEIMMIPGGLWASQQITTKLVNNVLQTVAEEKVVDDQSRQLPPVAPPQKLMPPREAIVENRRPQPAAFDTDLDDDVPF